MSAMGPGMNYCISSTPAQEDPGGHTIHYFKGPGMNYCISSTPRRRIKIVGWLVPQNLRGDIFEI